MRSSQTITTRPQNLSREMILPACKAAISPGPPIPPRATSHKPRTTVHLPLTNHHLPFTVYHLTLFCTNEPNFEKRQNELNLGFHKGLQQYGAFGHPKNEPKTNPNEPKRTQSKPNFWPARAPQSQNEPKRTQFRKRTNPVAFDNQRPA
jgi:hypothetical protein